jgi:hypothetical protein
MRGRRVLGSVMLRRLVVALGLVVLPLAGAAASPEPATAPDQVHNGGTIEGKVAAIDYGRSVLWINAGARGRINITVMPSTSIQGKDSGYHAFTDLKPGQRVQILSSIADGKYVAQIIRIR